MLPGEPPTLRAVIVELPELQAGIVRLALLDGGIEVVAEVSDRTELAGVLAAAGGEVIIVPTDRSGIATEYHRLLQRHPHLHLMTLNVAADRADLFELRSVGNNVGSADIARAVRAMVRAALRRVEDENQRRDGV